MRTFLIGYDLNQPVQNYPDLIEAIQAYGTWWHHLDSTWIVKSDRSATEIINDLRRYIDENGRVTGYRACGRSRLGRIQRQGL